MHKCEHSKAIAKFCMFEHCQSKQSGGCEDCIKKYHNHIGQISFLSQEDVKSIVKKFQIEPNYRPKSRPLQQCIFNFFTHVKANISQNLDLACKSFINEIGYPFLQKNGTLNCYKRLKNKQYRKVTQKQLKELWEIYKGIDYNDIVKEQKAIYNQAVLKMQSTIDKLQKSIKQMFETFNTIVAMNKSTNAFYDRSYYVKINQIFKEIKRYPDISFPKPQQNQDRKQAKKGAQSPTREKKLNRDARDVSLDKHVKFENKLKTEPLAKQQKKIFSPEPDKNKKEALKEQTQKEKQKPVKRVPKYSFEMKPQQMVIRPQKVQTGPNYSQKEEEINERKKKLMELMNSKPVKDPKISLNKGLGSTPIRQKTQPNRSDISDTVKDTISPNGYLLNKDFSTPSNTAKLSRQQIRPKSIIPNRQSYSSKRAKTTQQQEDQPIGSKKQTRNETVMSSSETETESLFNAKVHIPIEDTKQEEDFEIKQESVQKCIVVPQVDIIAKSIMDMVSECQSPLLMKKKEIQNFSAFMKLAESKIIEEQQEEQSPRDKSKPIQEEKSFVKINKVLQDSEVKSSTQTAKPESKQVQKVQNGASPKLRGQRKQQDSVQINDSQQMSLALLLKSLKLPGAQAIPYLQKAIQRSSNNLSAAQYLSYLYLQTQRPQDCLKLCNDILKLISSSQSNELALRLNINKSAALNYLGRYSECITFLERCLRYKHNDILYKNLADAYYSVGILEKAIYNYEHAIIQNSSNTQAHYNLAVCHYQQENYYNASIYIEKALKHQPTNQVYKEMKKHIDEKIMSNQM